jgi:uncharacterized membrane protein YidH (DUF202 family)
MEDLKLAPGWRGREGVAFGGVEDGDARAILTPGEYRTVLAEQRTLLAFVRTALAVTAVFGSDWWGAALGGTVLFVGVVQYLLGVDLFINRRTVNGVDLGRLLSRASVDSIMVGLVIASVAVAAVVHKASTESESTTVSSAVSSLL